MTHGSWSMAAPAWGRWVLGLGPLLLQFFLPFQLVAGRWGPEGAGGGVHGGEPGDGGRSWAFALGAGGGAQGGGSAPGWDLGAAGAAPSRYPESREVAAVTGKPVTEGGYILLGAWSKVSA